MSLPARRRSREQGFVLIVALLILVVMTLLSISMFRSFGLQERIAGSTREKQRALEGAQSALQYGEWWLEQGKRGAVTDCGSAKVDANDLAQMKVCNDEIAKPNELPWLWRAEYLPHASMSVKAGGGVKGNDINYRDKPGLHVYALGAPTLNPFDAQLFVVTAYGYGGSASTATVLQSTYQIKRDARALDGP